MENEAPQAKARGIFSAFFGGAVTANAGSRCGGKIRRSRKFSHSSRRIGGSSAKADKNKIVVIGSDKLGEVLKNELSRSANQQVEIIMIDKPFKWAVADADIVFLNYPSRLITKTLRQIKNWLKPGCVISDLSEKKEEITIEAEKILRNGVSFVGSLPLVDPKDVFSFHGKYWCLSSPLQTPNEQVLGQLIIGMGARIIIIHPQIHDFLVD